MQIIYAAPFILLSLTAFLCALAIPRFRPYVFRALIAPVAFGFCSIVAMVSILVAAHGLNLEFANAPLVGVRGVVEGIAIYFLPGVAGAWIAIEIVERVETRALTTQSRRDLAVRSMTALIAFGPVFIVCTGVQFKIFSKAEEWWPVVVAVAFAVAVFASTATYLLVRMFQRRPHAEPR